MAFASRSTLRAGQAVPRSALGVERGSRAGALRPSCFAGRCSCLLQVSIDGRVVRRARTRQESSLGSTRRSVFDHQAIEVEHVAKQRLRAVGLSRRACERRIALEKLQLASEPAAAFSSAAQRDSRRRTRQLLGVAHGRVAGDQPCTHRGADVRLAHGGSTAASPGKAASAASTYARAGKPPSRHMCHSESSTESRASGSAHRRRARAAVCTDKGIGRLRVR